MTALATPLWIEQPCATRIFNSSRRLIVFTHGRLVASPGIVKCTRRFLRRLLQPRGRPEPEWLVTPESLVREVESEMQVR